MSGKGLGPIDDQHDREEVAILERLGRGDDLAEAGGSMARIRSRIGMVERKWEPR